MPDPTPIDSAAVPSPPPRVRRSRFDDRLAGSLSRAPALAVSLGVHVLVAAALFLFGPRPKERLPTRVPDTAVLVATRSDADAGDSTEPLDRDDDPPAPDPASDAFVDPDPTTPDPAEPMPSPTGDPSADASPVGPPEEATTSGPSEIPGLDPSVIGLRVKPVRPPEAPLPPPPPPPGETPPLPVPSPVRVRPPTVNDEHATEINGKAAARIKDAIREPGSAFGRAMKGVKSEDLIVVSNGRSFDHLENVLDAVAIPYAHVSVAEFATRVELSRTRVVFWNCGPPIGESANRTIVAAKIAKFVEAGGFLWSTDWGLRDVVASAFPGRLGTGADQLRTLPDLVVEVRATAAGAGDPLLEGTLPASGSCHWWLEAAAAEVRVLDPSSVTVLLEAPLLATAIHRKSPVIAATFVAGKGRVLHVMGHAWQEKTDLDGTVGMQRLALNFVRMRVERDGPR